jgi:hypothetical protein
MNKPLHTPGPWYAQGNQVWGDQALNESTNTICRTRKIADFVGHKFTKYGEEQRDWGASELRANVHLCAAAPNMLTVLQELQESAAYWSEYDVPLGIVDRINDAITKATGGSQ